MKYFGRVKPYKAIGIKRLPCTRCGRSAYATWQACANGSRYLATCVYCDIKLNEMVLRYLRIPDYKDMIKVYKRKLLR